MAFSLLTRCYKNIVSAMFLLFITINTVYAQSIEQKEPHYSLQEIIDSGHIFWKNY